MHFSAQLGDFYLDIPLNKRKDNTMNATDVLKYGHETVLKTIEDLPESEWETTGVCGVWSVKDIIAHLASFELVLVDVLTMFLDGGPTPYMNRMVQEGDQFNDNWVAEYRDKTGAEALAEYCDAQARVMSLVVQIPAETLRQPGTLPGYGPEYALDDYIVYSYYGHKREHGAQIAVFRDRLADEAVSATEKVLAS
jgi:hypothetical protein